MGNASQNGKENELLPSARRHPAEKALTSPWSVNCFIVRNFYRPQGKVMFSYLSVILSTYGVGRPPGQRPPPLDRDPASIDI